MNNGSNDEENPEGMSSANEEDDFKDLLKDGLTQSLEEQMQAKGMSDRERKSRMKMALVNKRLDELIEVLDACVADLHAESKALSKLKNSLKTV